jgi:hypothetical protein
MPLLFMTSDKTITEESARLVLPRKHLTATLLNGKHDLATAWDE